MLTVQTIRFSFDGTRINESDTPKSLDMEDGDTIEVSAVDPECEVSDYYFSLNRMAL
jgi:hypothetical protein